MDLFSVLAAGLRLRASDIHLSVGAPPLARVNGQIVEIPGFTVLDAETCKRLVYSGLMEQQRARFEQDLELDCALSLPNVARFRMNVMVQRSAVEAVLRAVPPHIPNADMLGLGPTEMGFADLPRGLVLVTGPTGCGKTTTLACLIDYINLKYRKHVITVEDPIEFTYSRKNSLIRQREVGPDTRSFHEALRHALRQDPDVLLVGEMRDLESISLALTAAETGHLCFATLHTQDAAQTIDRVIDVFPEHQQPQVRLQLANTLKGVISQVLLPRKDGRGRIAAREVMVVNSAVSNLIREGKTHMIPNVVETGGGLGMQTLDRSLAELLRQGLIEPEDALAKAQDPRRFGLNGGAS